MKPTLSFLIATFLLAFLPCHAQTLDKALIEVMYDFEMVANRKDPQKKIKDEVILLIGPKYTHYFSFMNYITDSLRKANPAEYGAQIKSGDGKAISGGGNETLAEISARSGGSGSISVDRPRTQLPSNPFNKGHYLIHRKSGEVVFWDEMMNMQSFQTNYLLYQEILESPKWKIETATQTISQYPCQKATTHYGGRAWTVWFTHEIPLSEGPWKLRGLPGLILQAETADGEFKLFATSVSRSSNRDIVKDQEKDYRNLSKKEVFKLSKEAWTNPFRPIEYNFIEIVK